MKWFWMMAWCKVHGLAPANNDVWADAERAWTQQMEKANGNR